MIEKLLGFALVITRISAFFLVAPVFSWKSIPARIKVAMTILLAVFFSSVMTVPFDSGQVTFSEAIILLSNETIYGLALGLIVSLVFAAVKLGGRIIERQVGFAMAEILDPLTGERSQPISSLMEMIFIILFLSVNAHHLFLLTLSRSFDSFPTGSTPTVEIMTTGLTQAGSAMFVAGLKIAAPILAAFILLMIVLAVLARIVPEMNILFLSLPLRVGLGLLMTAIFLPFIRSFVTEFAEKISVLLPL